LICDEKLRQKIGQDATGTVAQLLGKFERSSHAKQVIEWMIRTGI
jgi:hypothetical protein